MPQTAGPQIAEEIERRGPIPFRRFMELALYGRHGYYTRSNAGIGREADFVTAPELSPAMGATLSLLWGRLRGQLGAPGPRRFCELGPGRGRLLSGFLDGLDWQRLEPPELVAVEAGENQRQQVTAVAQAHQREIQLLDGPGRLGRLASSSGLIVANEFFDALPVHRVRGGASGSLEEAFVDVAETGFREIWRPATEPQLLEQSARLGLELRSGRQAEVGVAAPAALRTAAASLTRGLMVIIDYGYPAGLLYGTEGAPTLRAFRGGRLITDLLSDPGEQDITAHVDFSSLARAGEEAGLERLLFADQASFLVGLGAHELPESLRTGFKRLVNPEEMGGTMKVLVLGRGVEPDLLGDVRDRSRML